MVSNGFEESASGMRQLAGTSRSNQSGSFLTKSHQYRRADATPLAELQQSIPAIVSPIPKFRQTTLTCETP